VVLYVLAPTFPWALEKVRLEWLVPFESSARRTRSNKVLQPAKAAITIGDRGFQRIGKILYEPFWQWKRDK